ncbi:hypothetical protein ACEXQB_012525 [Herbiconiux sp. P18]|uniref:hypothetical protein n=1 Tax=Herbiconiux liangxiaofengii TaxID=3342795 RepID=UPI0035B78D82
MQTAHPSTDRTPHVPFAGALVIARVRRVVITAVLAAIAYSLVTTASRSQCAGPSTMVAGTDGTLTNAQACISLAVGPSPLVYISFVVILIVALSRVVKKAEREADALRTLDRAAMAIAIVAGASILITVLWVAMVPLDTWSPLGSFSIWYPFPFANVDTTITP